MSNQLDAAAIIFEALRVLLVNTNSARIITSQATLDNLPNLATAVYLSINGTWATLEAWIKAIQKLDPTPFDDETSDKVITPFSDFVRVYTDLMIEIILKHGVLTSEKSPYAPDGAVIGGEIFQLQRQVESLQNALRPFIPNRVNDLVRNGRLARDAYELAASRYPVPIRPEQDGSDDSTVPAAARTFKLPDAPGQK
ncbi:hypothetical protein C2E23DRAFT_857206 [Lenzites betulinus]|nr:hypothetical protein C2E23DRAFT_857206 [Lenzites betulinus]